MLEEDQLLVAPPAAAAANAAPPPDAIDAELSEAASAWLSSNIIIIDGVFHCLDPDQPVPQYVQDWMDHHRAQIESMKQENQLASHAAAAAHATGRTRQRNQQGGVRMDQFPPCHRYRRCNSMLGPRSNGPQVRTGPDGL